MNEIAHSLLSGWESFYVIVGSSAAALTGLNFVVVALGADRGFLAQAGSQKASAAFSSPTIVHFSGVLLISSVLSAPWHDVSGMGWWIALFGVAGLIYTGIVIRRARGQTAYDPVLEDWIWHVILPIVAYGAMLVAGLEFRGHTETALFIIGGAALLLLYIGIHNAWDAATWLAIERPKETGERSAPSDTPRPGG